jgi:hypothetical protein
MIKGTPGHVAHARKLASSGDRLRSVRGIAIAQAHQKLLETAAQYPEWDAIKDGITFHDGGDEGVTFSFDPAHPAHDRAFELEYGSPTQAPISIFRTVLGDNYALSRDFTKRVNR